MDQIDAVLAYGGTVFLFALLSQVPRGLQGLWMLSPMVLLLLGYYFPLALALDEPLLVNVSPGGFSFVLLAPGAAFFLGCLYHEFLLRRSRSAVAPSTYNSPNEDKVVRKLSYVFLITGLVGFVLNYWSASTTLGVANPLDAETREWELAFGFSVLSNYLYFTLIIALMFSYYGFFLGRTGKDALIELGKIVCISALLLFHGLKSTVIFPHVLSFIFALVIYKFRGFELRSIRVRLLTALFSLLAVVWLSFYVISGWRYGLIGSATSDHGAAQELATEHLKSYVSYNYLNFMLEVDDRHEWEIGSWLVAEVLKPFTRLTEWLGETAWLPDIEFMLFDEGYNAGTIFRGAYIDMGWLGVAVYGFLFGLIAQSCFRSAQSRPTFFRIVLYATVAGHIAFAFYLVQPFRWQFVFILVCAYALSRLISRMSAPRSRDIRTAPVRSNLG